MLSGSRPRSSEGGALSTLRFAMRAKQIQTVAKVNRAGARRLAVQPHLRARRGPQQLAAPHTGSAGRHGRRWRRHNRTRPHAAAAQG